MKELKIKRATYTATSTIGEMTLDGKHICWTLEDKVRGLKEAKVYGKTAIPAGRYQVIIDHSNAFGKDMPHVLNVPGFEGIRIHQGNHEIDSLGCVLIGLQKGPDAIFDSAKAFQIFMPVLKTLLKAGSVFLVIEDSKH